MATKNIFNTDLITDIANQKVIVFVGAGASKWAQPSNGKNFKDWNTFLLEASKRAPRRIRKLVKERLDVKDYLIASELLRTSLAETWNTVLEEEFQQASPISRLHKAIISLKPRIIVTTNFDKLIESAWNDEVGLKRYPKVISKIDSHAFKLFRDDESYLIKIHGSIDEPGNIVFDKTSFQRGAFSNQYYQDLISTLLLTHTFLFIGFSMDDPAVSLLVESHAYRYSESRPHYAFVSGKSQPEIDNVSRTTRKLFVLRYPVVNGEHTALADQIEELARRGASKRKELLATAP